MTSVRTKRFNSVNTASSARINHSLTRPDDHNTEIKLTKTSVPYITAAHDQTGMKWIRRCGFDVSPRPGSWRCRFSETAKWYNHVSATVTEPVE